MGETKFKIGDRVTVGNRPAEGCVMTTTNENGHVGVSFGSGHVFLFHESHVVRVEPPMAPNPGKVTHGHGGVYIPGACVAETAVDHRERPGPNAASRFKFNADGVLLLKQDGETDHDFHARVWGIRSIEYKPPACDYCEDTRIGKLGMECPACVGGRS